MLSGEDRRPVDYSTSTLEAANDAHETIKRPEVDLCSKKKHTSSRVSFDFGRTVARRIRVSLLCVW